MSDAREAGIAIPPKPGITVVDGDPLPFFRSVADGADAGPTPPLGLCLLSGGIVARNLTRRLAAEGIPTDLVETGTIEDLAAELVAATDGRPVRVADPPVRKRLVEAVLTESADHDTPLGRFARRVSVERGEVVDGVVSELDEYYRCTDAGRDRDRLSAVVEAVADEHPYAADRTRESVRAFGAVDRRLADLFLERNDDADDRVYRSRSHLVAAARDAVEDAWSRVVGDPDWVAMASVSALDDPTLRLLACVAEEAPLVVFAGPGTAGPFARRIDAALSGSVPVRRNDGGASPDPVGPLLSAATGASVAAPPGVETVAVPDRRREIEYALRTARERTGSTVLVAPDAGEYATPVRDVALTRDCPFRVETRREVRTLPAFGAVAATVRLVAAADAGAVSPGNLLEPLRLAACPPTDVPGDWPLSASALGELAELVDGEDPERSIAAWRSTVADADETVAGVGGFLEWVDEARRDPPADGAGLRTFLEGVLSAHAEGVRDRPVRRVTGVAVETGRARVDARHPVDGARRVRAAIPAASRTYDWLLGALDRPADWETALAALRQGAGSETYGLGRTDADAVEVVDAGNAYFRRADTAVVLGLSADRFPRPSPTASFLHPAVRAAVARRREAFPYLYLDGEATQYERDLDVYGAALRVARESVVLVRPYKDEDGRDVAPSPFLDSLSVPDRRRTRVAMGDWIALGGAGTGTGPAASGGVAGGGDGNDDARDGAELAGGDGNDDARDDGKSEDGDGNDGDRKDGDWDALWASLSRKERLRGLAHYANRPSGRGPDREAVWRLADRICGDDGAPERVRRRIERFRAFREDEDG